ncbi:hypothetical protein BGU94_18935, partial [Clostridioides difficile]
GKTADTGEIDVVVPAKSTDGEIQAEVQAEADKITSVTQPTQEATTLTMQTVESGYTIKIKSSTNESVIAKDGTIVSSDTDTAVALGCIVTHTSSGKKADTGETAVTVPARTALEPEQLSFRAQADKIPRRTPATQTPRTHTSPARHSGTQAT